MDSNSSNPPVLQASPDWRCIEFISDLHLHPAEAATFEAWQQYLVATQADALIILGDLFEVWVGDDAVAEASGFEARCADILTAAARQRPVFFMHGNRDFLLGHAFFKQTHIQLLGDPSMLQFGGQRYLLSHGDALCLGDHAYQSFRSEVRSAAWQSGFLAKPLAERVAIARQIRAHSDAQKRQAKPDDWHDLDVTMAKQWLTQAQAPTMIHGHTHQPAAHELGDGLQRIVLSDWDLAAAPPRAQVLQLSWSGTATAPTLKRVNLV